MFTVNLTAGAVFALGIGVGVILGAIGLVIIAVSSNKKSNNNKEN